MRPTQQSPSSPRTLARTICSQINSFFDQRITSALESAADELEAQNSIEEMHDRAIADAVRQEVATIRSTAGRAPKTFCQGLSSEVERGLLFAEENAGATSESGGKRRHVYAEGFEVSLLSDDELELSVMVSTVASRFERRNREGVERIIHQVSKGYGDERGERLRTQIGVIPLINRFSNMLAGVALSVPTRSRLMNAFQFHVLEELSSFYLPLAQSLEGTPARRPGTPARAPASATVGAPVRPEGFSGWVDLLNQSRAMSAGDAGSGPAAVPGAGGKAGHGGSAGPGGAAGMGAAGGGPLISQEQLFECLTNLPALFHGATDGAANDTATLYDQVVAGLQQKGLTPAQMPPMDLDVLRLVSLFFEKFLGDDKLPAALRFLVGRLQMPVLRLALSDHSFFDDTYHPARRLIETLCRVGVGWSSDMAWVERSPAFKQVNTLIDDILHHSSIDTGLFEDAVEQLESTHAVRTEKADRVEGRVVELEVGRAKLRAAKLVVQEVLNEYLVRHRSLTPLKDFFADAWSRVLVFICLRHGSESDEWQSATALCEELAALMTPAGSREESKRRFATVPNLLERLETRMVEAGISSSAVDQSIEELYAEIDRIRESEDEWFASAGEMLIEQQEEIEPITLIPVAEQPELEADVQVPDWVQPGNWIRVREGMRESGEAERYQQVKIAARVADTREILLVDERGARWGIWSEAEFAAALHEGRIAEVESDDLVQKTLDAMIAELTRQSPAEEVSRLSAG